MCVGRPGAAGGDFLPKSDFWTKRLSFCRKWVNYTKKSIFAPRGPEGGHATPFLSFAHVENIWGCGNTKNTFRVKSFCEVKSNFAQKIFFCRKWFSQWGYNFPPMAPNHCEFLAKSMLREVKIAKIVDFKKWHISFCEIRIFELRFSFFVKIAILT